jgi:hypothetical protein
MHAVASANLIKRCHNAFNFCDLKVSRIAAICGLWHLVKSAFNVRQDRMD